MKYIRTNYGTIELNKEEIEREITAQADTIEELIDEFIIIENKGGLPYVRQKETTLFWLEHGWKPYALYGAIWTDKGLIYVAKMNDRGELCLL